MNFMNTEIKGQSIQTIEVAGVQATDVLQAELIAEREVNRYAKAMGYVNSTERWEKTYQHGNIYSIKFF